MTPEELVKDNARLRALLKESEDDKCFWCGAQTVPDEDSDAEVEQHAEDCEAFHPDGSVR